MNGAPRRVLFTRAPRPGGPEERVLAAAGCAALSVPVLRFEPGGELARLGPRLREAPPLDLVLVTSRHAAEALARVLRGLSPAARPRCAAVGDATARPLREAGVEVDVPPASDRSRTGAAALAAHVLKRLANGSRVLFARGNLSLEVLPGALRARGVEVEELEVYRTTAAAPEVAGVLEALEQGRVAAAVFTSPSGVEALHSLVPAEAWDRLMELPAVAPGDATAGALLEAGARRIERAAEAGEGGIAAALAHALLPRAKDP
ncbi:MAG TPA: uroporphyrinogen-III synthase [Candidatus Saccharimonadales bacterium]|nr:uroporphyrinogen-III synthase [Candidatus Saccharimonadales bacterium]